MYGNVTWRQIVDIRYSDGFQNVEMSSEFIALDGAERLLVGSSHTFYLHRRAQDILVIEALKNGQDEEEVIGIYRENDNEVVRREDPDQVLVYPRTKCLENGPRFVVRVGYSVPTNYSKLETEFNLDIDFTMYLKGYIEKLGWDPSKYGINQLTVHAYAPNGCSWGVDKEGLLGKLPESGCLIRDQNNTHVQGNEISFSLNPAIQNDKSRIILQLPVVRSVEEAQHARDDATGSPVGHAPEECVVFVCDLRGSSDMSVDGYPSVDLLRFRKIWRRDKEAPFRMVKVIGDMAMVVCNPDVFRAAGFAEIFDLYKRTLALGVRLRGGFHLGKAQATGDVTESMIGDRVGYEFLGDAINYGAKIGDFKENSEGLIASGEFLQWFLESDNLPKLWQTKSFGERDIDLYRIDIGHIRHNASTHLTVASKQAEQHFADRLIERSKLINSRLIVGLDPDINKFPEFLCKRFFAAPLDSTLEDIIFEFHQAVIDSTAEFAAAFKPQAAFYEQYGYAGIRALHRTIRYLRDLGLPVILDAKRNDIEHTASAYGRAWLGRKHPLTGNPNGWRVDAITINGYLGLDGIKPFLDVDPHAGLFVLAKTSNPSSSEFQDLVLQEDGLRNYEKMATLAELWGKKTIGNSGYSRIGLVVGATYPEASARLRELAPTALFLMPGVGAQGAELDSVAMGCDEEGFGAFAASSRSVLYKFDHKRASVENTWRDAVQEASGNEAKKIKEGIQNVIEK